MARNAKARNKRIESKVTKSNSARQGYCPSVLPLLSPVPDRILQGERHPSDRQPQPAGPVLAGSGGPAARPTRTASSAPGPGSTAEKGRRKLSSILNILFLYWVKQGAEQTSAPKYNRTESITGTETIEHRE